MHLKIRFQGINIEAISIILKKQRVDFIEDESGVLWPKVSGGRAIIDGNAPIDVWKLESH